MHDGVGHRDDDRPSRRRQKYRAAIELTVADPGTADRGVAEGPSQTTALRLDCQLFFAAAL
jgi:hypothetical protein